MKVLVGMLAFKLMQKATCLSFTARATHYQFVHQTQWGANVRKKINVNQDVRRKTN